MIRSIKGSLDRSARRRLKKRSECQKPDREGGQLSRTSPLLTRGLLTLTYSYLKHSIGSNRAALRAGQTPKIKPTPTLTVIPAVTAHIGIEAGRLGIKNITSLLIPIARITPSIPPKKVSVIASNRN